MRIVAGAHKGRKLAAPGGRAVRPTSDRVRQAIFNILEHRLDVDFRDLAVADIFAGSGALGLEAISRGARHAVFVDNAAASLACVRANIAALGVERKTTVVRADARRLGAPPAGTNGAGLAFLDPPYATDCTAPALTGLAENGWLVPDALCVVEVPANTNTLWPPAFDVGEDRRYGDTRIFFLQYRMGR